MNKFILKTFNQVNEYDFIKMTIFIENYKIKAKRNQIITPEAAKIIIESTKKIHSFVILSPIIEVDDMGNANCWTSSSFEETAYKMPYYKTLQEKKDIEDNIKLLNAKSKLGLTPDEVIEFASLKSIAAATKLIKHKSNFIIGGGL